MNSRSRKGCIDCRRAKVKCDEIQPQCGTCDRRGYVCQGYDTSAARADQLDVKGRPVPRQLIRKRRLGRPPRSALKTLANTPSSPSSHSGNADDDAAMKTIQEKTREVDVAIPPASPRLDQRSQLCSHVSFIPSGTISRADEATIEMYFGRHPEDLVMGHEFVTEMNSNVLTILRNDPAAVSDSLSAIGHAYLKDTGSSKVVELQRKARIFTRLRQMNDGPFGLEKMLLMLLGLCALEMIDEQTKAQDMMLPSLVANAALVLKHQTENGRRLDHLAKYFVRALARQDMMIALTYAHEAHIPTDIWLDDWCRDHADRFMGYTMTLMPILRDLCVLAEALRGPSCAPGDLTSSSGEAERSDSGLVLAATAKQAEKLRNRIVDWKPTPAKDMSFESSQRMLFHAFSYQSAALLYLHRLTSPPGSSADADGVAAQMAHEVLAHLSKLNGQLKTSLWPVFVAGTELMAMDERKIAADMFDAIFELRHTVTALRTKAFCVGRVWVARDAGLDWNWLRLVHQYPNECLPI